ncbi:hypothetical protein [Borrelia venezuelensis]|nr:hypothetical protein [Borrelia venezuelensis]UPA12729.1 hypothetical protein bvRMA01_001068 [Borrelia venezuelensis]
MSIIVRDIIEGKFRLSNQRVDRNYVFSSDREVEYIFSNVVNFICMHRG